MSNPSDGNGEHQPQPAVILPPEVLDQIPPDALAQLRAQGFPIPPEGTANVVVRSFQGPIPPASELRELEALHPGITRKWFEMVEQDVASSTRYRDAESDNSRELTKASIARSRDGQWLAAALSAVAILGAITLIAFGQVWGAALLTVPVVQLIQAVLPRPLRNPRTGEDPPK